MRGFLKTLKVSWVKSHTEEVSPRTSEGDLIGSKSICRRN